MVETVLETVAPLAAMMESVVRLMLHNPFIRRWMGTSNVL